MAFALLLLASIWSPAGKDIKALHGAARLTHGSHSRVQNQLTKDYAFWTAVEQCNQQHSPALTLASIRSISARLVPMGE